jgi:hypothetical protein
MDETSLISTSKVLQVGLLFSETLMMKVAVTALDFASDAVEAARRRVVKLICEGQVASIKGAVELVTDDAELRAAVYETVRRGREDPQAMNLADVTAIARRAQAVRAAPQA